MNRKIRFLVLYRDGFKCRYCGREGTSSQLHVDHIVPLSQGGSNELSNLITSCKDCNRGKSDFVIESVAADRDALIESMATRSKNHGGNRSGAGRKSADGAQGLTRRNVMLDDETVAEAMKIGFGSISVGLRKAVKAYSERRENGGTTQE